MDATDRYLIVYNKFIARLYHKKCKAAKIATSLLQYPLAKFGRFHLPVVSLQLECLKSQDYSNSKGVKQKSTRRDEARKSVIQGVSKRSKGSKDREIERMIN